MAKHITVMTLKVLKEVMTIHGFKIEKVMGAGYFPLPAKLGKIFKRHSNFVTIKARKL